MSIQAILFSSERPLYRPQLTRAARQSERRDQLSELFQKMCSNRSLKLQFSLLLSAKEIQQTFLFCFPAYQKARTALEDQKQTLEEAVTEIDSLSRRRVELVEEIREKSERAAQVQQAIEDFQMNNGYATKEQWREIDRALSLGEKPPHFNRLMERHHSLIEQQDKLDESLSALRLELKTQDAKVYLAQAALPDLISANAEFTRQMHGAVDQFIEVLENRTDEELEQNSFWLQISSLLSENI